MKRIPLDDVLKVRAGAERMAMLRLGVARTHLNKLVAKRLEVSAALESARLQVPSAGTSEVLVAYVARLRKEREHLGELVAKAQEVVEEKRLEVVARTQARRTIEEAAKRAHEVIRVETNRVLERAHEELTHIRPKPPEGQ